MKFYQLLGYCQPQAGTARRLCFGLSGLLKGFEYAVEIGRWYADPGIFDADGEHVAGAVRRHSDFALLGKFDGVANQIMEYLGQPVFICQGRWQVFFDGVADGQGFLFDQRL